MMAVDGRVLRQLVPALLKCLLLLHVLGYVSSVKGDCIWYGVCSTQTEYKRLNCHYNGPAKPVQEKTRFILEKYCPQFASGPVCCDNDQLINLKTNIALPENLLARCPSCMDNYLQHICGMTCSPNQSDFIKPLMVEQFNATHQRVMAINYHLSTTYKEATYRSCQEIVPIPELNGTVMDLMCGEYGAANCTANRMFQFMGDAYSNPYVPFQVNFVGGDESLDGHTPYNPPTRHRGWNATEQGCYKIKPTTNEDIGGRNTVANRFEKENDSLIIVKISNLTKLDASENKIAKTKEAAKTDCELLYKQEERKLQVEEDYYTFKKAYLRQKLILMREQTEALKMISNKMLWRPH